MKKTHYFIIVALVATMCILAACHENTNDDTNDDNIRNELVTISGKISIPISNITWDDCSIMSIDSESQITNGTFDVNAYTNDKVQTFIVQNNGDIYLLGRTPITNNRSVELNIKSTAIAMVTLHPLFSPVEKSDYTSLVNIIEGSPKYQVFYDEVEKTVTNKRSLYDESNEELLIAFSNLMEELCGEAPSDGDYDEALDDINTRSKTTINTRAVYQHSQINPTYIDAQITNNILSLSTVWVTPSYYGTVSQPNGTIVNKVIPSRSDFGIMDLAFNRTTRGEPMKYNFSYEGNYRFNFSRVNAEATLDFYMRIAGTILSTLGLSIDGNDDAVVEAAKYISNAITAAGSGVSDSSMSALDWLGIAYDAALSQISTTGKLGSHTFSQAFVTFSKVLASSFNWYNKIKGAANLGLRLAYAFDAPETIKFCLCYYDNEITTCTEASLYKVGGDEQTGYANQKLLLPLTVYIQTIGDDGNYHEASSYHRVKFEVISGGGEVEFDWVSADNNNQASTYWTLGKEGKQQVKATVIDIITEKEISEPVYFTATLDNAAITIRLDWSKHSGNTDIDLHVVDPNGEEIAFYNMTSSSGGYLDRDDTVGPGPEHVRWSNAPAGTYKIYVHYYPNEAEDRSVTSYTVSVTADGIKYMPKTNSIAYDQYVPVGQFTIGESTPTRSVSTHVLSETEKVNKKVFPKK